MNTYKRLFAFLLFLNILFFGKYSLMAQSEDSMDQASFSLNHIARYVYDLEKSTTFYENILQLKQIPEPFKDGKHTWFQMGPHSQLHLIEGAPEKMEHHKHNHLCFSVKSVDDFIARLDEYEVAHVNWLGTSRGPNIRVDGVKQIYFQDPDGYWLEINDDYIGREKKK